VPVDLAFAHLEQARAKPFSVCPELNNRLLAKRCNSFFAADRLIEQEPALAEQVFVGALLLENLCKNTGPRKTRRKAERVSRESSWLTSRQILLVYE
jgi:hypothetical protein